MNSGEFEILMFDKTRATLDQYQIGSLHRTPTSLSWSLKRRDEEAATLPARISVTYPLNDGPYFFKDVFVEMPEGEKTDRLQVMHFSTEQKASRGGHGQPVFIGNWFFGINYPCFHSRHSDGFEEPAFHHRWHYTLDLDFGIWVAIDGTISDIGSGLAVGYQAAVPPDFNQGYQQRVAYWGPQRYFNILNPKYQEDYKKAAR